MEAEAAGEAHPAVHDDELAVLAGQVLVGGQRAEDAHLAPGLLQRGRHLVIEAHAAHGVHQHAALHARPHALGEERDERIPRQPRAPDVERHVHRRARAADGLLDGREHRAVVEPPHGVASLEPGLHRLEQRAVELCRRLGRRALNLEVRLPGPVARAPTHRRGQEQCKEQTHAPQAGDALAARQSPVPR